MTEERRPRRTCKNKDGSQKITYASRDAARKARRLVAKTPGFPRLGVYKCGECYGYHLGNAPKWANLGGW